MSKWKDGYIELYKKGCCSLAFKVNGEHVDGSVLLNTKIPALGQALAEHLVELDDENELLKEMFIGVLGILTPTEMAQAVNEYFEDGNKIGALIFCNALLKEAFGEEKSDKMRSALTRIALWD